MNIIQDILQKLKTETGDNDIIFSFKNGKCVFSNQYTHDEYYYIRIQNIKIDTENFAYGSDIIRVTSVIIFIDNEKITDNAEVNKEFRDEHEIVSYYSQKYGVDESKISVDLIPSTAWTEDRREEN